MEWNGMAWLNPMTNLFNLQVEELIVALGCLGHSFRPNSLLGEEKISKSVKAILSYPTTLDPTRTIHLTIRIHHTTHKNTHTHNGEM